MAGKSSENGSRAGRGIPAGQTAASAGQLARQARAIRKPDPQRTQILQSLPLAIKQSFIRAKVDAVLSARTWPDSLPQKLGNYLVEEMHNNLPSPNLPYAPRFHSQLTCSCAELRF